MLLNGYSIHSISRFFSEALVYFQSDYFQDLIFPASKNVVKYYLPTTINYHSISKFLNLINPLLEDFMKDNSVGLILDKKNIFISKSNYDITMKILEIVNENIKSISIE